MRASHLYHRRNGTNLCCVIDGDLLSEREQAVRGGQRVWPHLPVDRGLGLERPFRAAA